MKVYVLNHVQMSTQYQNQVISVIINVYTIKMLNLIKRYVLRHVRKKIYIMFNH